MYRFSVWLYGKTIGHYLANKKEKKRRAYSEQMKSIMLAAAGCGFSVYGNKEFRYENENEYFC